MMGIIITLVFSCNNENNEIAPDPLPACFLLKENLLGDPGHTLFEYASGNPASICHLRDAGDTIDVTEIFAEKIIKNNIDKIYPTNSSTLIKYDADILSDSPSIANIYFTENNKTTEDRTLSFRYDRNGRMIELMQQLSSSTRFTLTIEYDENNNVNRLHYHYPDYTDTITIVATGYDSKPTPYAGIKGWKFIASGAIWNSANHHAALTALSQNNPKGYLHFVNDNETQILTYEYQYNEHGFPTQRDQVYKTETSEIRTTYVYDYVCP
jgi:hypothetical protein